MDNAEIAAVFDEIADILEIKGENPFRIGSYRSASRAIEGLTTSLAAIVSDDEGKLEDIPGIGKSMHEKIVELLATGHLAFLDKLLEETPPGLLEMLRLSGLGPKKVALFYRELSIDSVDKLEAAARSCALRALPGMGEKSEEKIIRAVESYRRVASGASRFTLSRGTKYLDGYVAYLKGLSGVSKAVSAGSLRRWQETIGDLDILVTCAAGTPVMEYFAAYPEVTEVVAKGGTKCTVVLNCGIQVDLRVVEEESFGAALQYFTGSKEHNVALRKRAKKTGLKVNEYGVFKVAGGEKVAGRTEAEVYGALGIDHVPPPELRVDRGEIELAEADSLPLLVTEADIRGDLHLHTVWSDGAGTVSEMAEAAMEAGYEYIAVTDHSQALSVARGLSVKSLREQIDEIRSVNEELSKRDRPFKILTGIEVDIMADGRLDLTEEVLKELDWVVASVHSGFDMDEERMTGRVLRAFETGLVDVLAHPTGRLIGVREPFRVDMERVMDGAAEASVAMEVNSFPERLDLKDTHCRLAREKGVKVVISTDSHSASNFGNMVYGVHTARRGGLTKEDVLNTGGVEELLKGVGKS